MITLSIISPNSPLSFDAQWLHRLCSSLDKLTTAPFRRHSKNLCLRFTLSQTQAVDITLCQQGNDNWRIERIDHWHKLNTNQPAILHLFDFKKRLFQSLDTPRYSMNLMQHEPTLKASFELWQSTFLQTKIIDAQLRLLP
ncbi:hypothetical protein MD535_16420 [Vibrio sp. ZSDZ65]|uniref:DUF2787 domain-containing protein n=1 Tax=Vibrio qingdaonensis TaxID=2829491 RepID=A0A9X3HY89_9VIBR|nr:hypothetical protein [Vibrio qingdaonensis]MCW8347587.1 hypothetical protein [Vibrio qingdaonensis]